MAYSYSQASGAPEPPPGFPQGSPSTPPPPSGSPKGAPPKDKKKCGKINPDGTKEKCSCWPLIVYLALSALVIVGYVFTPSAGLTAASVMLNIVWIIIFSFILHALCKNGHTGIAWFLLFLPLIIMVIFLFLAIFVWA